MIPQLVSCYRASGLLWIHDEATEDEHSDMNYAELSRLVLVLWAHLQGVQWNFLKSFSHSLHLKKKKGKNDYLHNI